MKSVRRGIYGGLVLTLAWAGLVFAWGSATHVFVDDNIGRKDVVANANEMYGGMAPDIFNYMFDYPALLPYLYQKTHSDLAGLKKNARTPSAKAFAYGFISHNQDWGADATAHNTSPDDTIKYIDEKADAVKARLLPLLAAAGLGGLPAGAVKEVGHILTEYGIDLMLTRTDPNVGYKVATAAAVRSPDVPGLLVKTYAQGLAQEFPEQVPNVAAAGAIIAGAEAEFRKTMVGYGSILLQPEPIAKQMVIAQLTRIAPGYLASLGIPAELLTGVDLAPLLEAGLDIAMEEAAGDYLQAVRNTIDYVKTQIRSNHVRP